MTRYLISVKGTKTENKSHRKVVAFSMQSIRFQMLPSFYKLMKPDEEIRREAKRTITKELVDLQKELGSCNYFGGMYMQLCIQTLASKEVL
jgi:hypothetical protein